MSGRRFQFDTTVGQREAEVRVTYSISPIVEATYWQPAEGGEIEIVSVKQGGKEVFLSQDEMDALHEEAAERSGEDLAGYQADVDDWRYQEYRDRLLMERFERENGQ